MYTWHVYDKESFVNVYWAERVWLPTWYDSPGYVYCLRCYSTYKSCFSPPLKTLPWWATYQMKSKHRYWIPVTDALTPKLYNVLSSGSSIVYIVAYYLRIPVNITVHVIVKSFRCVCSKVGKSVMASFTSTLKSPASQLAPGMRLLHCAVLSRPHPG